ncbi:MAG: HAD family phosphatase [Proteobacteria bacterium]|nr:HAD family phosphatase [Pseudomonadota bacterium]
MIIQPCAVRVVLFDFGGVLSEEGFRDGLISIALFNKLDPAVFVKRAYAVTFADGFVTGRMDEREFWQTLREQTGITGSDADLRSEVLSRFQLRPWMMKIVEQLKGSGIRLAILSDQTKWLDELNEAYNFFQWFERVFNSYHMGKSKQDPTIFDDVVYAMNILPEQTLFVDDRLANVERAQGKGLHTIHYRDRKFFEQEIVRFFPSIRCN